MFLGGCALLVITLLWYRQVMPAAEAREEDRLAEQFIALKQQLSAMGEPIVLKGASGVAVLLVAAAGLVVSGQVAFMDPATDTIVMFACFVFGAAILALFVGPDVGKPPLTIRWDGLSMPVYGFLRWDEIDSIGLQSHTYRGVTTHSLDLYVPQLKERESKLHPLLRVSRYLLARRSPNFILVHLKFTKLPATLVYQLCYDVWKARTGRARAWTATMSEEEIERARRSEAQFEGLKRLESEADLAKERKLLDEVNKHFDDPSMRQRAGQRLSPETIARTQALIFDLGRLGSGDPAARHRLVEKHANAYARDRGTTIAIVVVVLVALVVTALTLTS
ncbi:MAG TPA: hypothetical protein VGD45_00500 [Steroidobacter sp.]|uniref:hypothetical protein n=1 Tax=Steroidobacter sp. TaxID=1978227 RepID=UPI002EDBB5DE